MNVNFPSIDHGPVTEHDVDELLAQRRRLNTCNGNCKQGRACDCVPAIPDPEEDDQSQGVSALELVRAAGPWPWVLVGFVIAFLNGWRP